LAWAGVRKGNNPMLRAERPEYLRAALAGVEKARVTLAKATDRIIDRLAGQSGVR
jgi:hypothetical protein